MAAAGSNPVFADTEQSLVRRNGVLAHRQPGLGLTTPTQGMYLMNGYSVVKREERIKGHRWGTIKPQKKILSLGSQWEGEKYNPKNEKNFYFRVVFFLISLATKWRGYFSVNLNLEN